MRFFVSVAVVVALGLLAGWGMRRGWAARSRRTDAWVPDLPPVPGLDDVDALGPPRSAPVTATYVSSTRTGDWLDRVTAHGLGVLSPATVQVFASGVHIARTGAPDLFVPAAGLQAVGTTGGMAGKYVGRDGIVVLTWRTGPGDGPGLDTGLRPRRSADREVLLAAARTLLPDTSVPGDPTAHKEKP